MVVVGPGPLKHGILRDAKGCLHMVVVGPGPLKHGILRIQKAASTWLL